MPLAEYSPYLAQNINTVVIQATGSLAVLWLVTFVIRQAVDFIKNI